MMRFRGSVLTLDKGHGYGSFGGKEELLNWRMNFNDEKAKEGLFNERTNFNDENSKKSLHSRLSE